MNIYICSTQLQFINALNIEKQLNSHFYKSFFFLRGTNFFWKKNFIYRVKKKKIKIALLRNYSKIVKKINTLIENKKNIIDKIFIEDDRASLGLIFKKIKSENINLYEEGFAIYLNKSIGKGFLGKIKWKLISFFLGCGSYFGGSRFIKSVYIYFPNFYVKKNKIVKIKKNYFNFINRNLKFLNYIFNFKNSNFKNKEIKIFASDSLTKNINLKKFLKDNNDIIIKKHPHDKRIFKSTKKPINTNIPLELVVANLIKKKKIKIFFESFSSSLIYLKKTKIKMHLLNDNKKLNQFFSIKCKI